MTDLLTKVNPNPQLESKQQRQSQKVETIHHFPSDPWSYLEIRRWPDGQTRELLRFYN